MRVTTDRVADFGSPAQSIALSNYVTTAVNTTGITVTTNFGETDNCIASVASEASCTIKMTSTPSSPRGC